MTTLPDLEPAALEAAITDEQIGEWCAEAQSKCFGVIPQARYVIARALTARSAPEAGKAVVKPLHWRHQEDSAYITAVHPFGEYTIDISNGIRGHYGRYFSSVEEAKSVYETAYQSCVLSALASVPAPSGAGKAVDGTAHDLIMRSVSLLSGLLMESPKFSTELNDKFFALRDDMRQWLVDQADAALASSLTDAEVNALLDELSRLRTALESAHKGLKAGCDQYAVKSIGGVEIPGDEQYPWVRMMQIGRDAAARVLFEREGQDG